jgi:hypothetical protein
MNSKKISIDKKPFTITKITERLNSGAIITSDSIFPPYTEINDFNASRLIESILIGLHLPVIYCESDTRGNLTILDGNKIINAIRDFRNFDFELEGLEYFENLNTKFFDELPVNHQNKIIDTELTFVIINPGTPKEIRDNLIDRIKTYS